MANHDSMVESSSLTFGPLKQQNESEVTNNNHHENNNNSHIESPNPAPNQQHPLNQLYENVVNAVISSGSTVENLSDESRHRVWLELVNYETRHARRLEEKELAIGELKKSLCDLTEKRFRTHLQQHPNESEAAESSGNAPPPLSNIEFMLDEKEAHVRELLKELEDKSAEILKLKQTIKDQDLIILSHNTNIYELKSSHETVLRAKQESFRMMNEDLAKRQKLIDDQTLVIKSLREKIESLEEENEKSRADLESRLNEREADLKLKIATFEANLNEGRHYFEDVLREKQAEIEQLKRKLADNEQEPESPSKVDAKEKSPSPAAAQLSSPSTSSLKLEKFDTTSLDSLKSLYEHQLGLLKTRNEMLERTCTNYARGIKEMSANFGIQQNTDELASMATFKELMIDLQKQNVQLETERIDLQVRAAKLREECDQVRVEKEHMSKRAQTLAESNQKLMGERQDLVDSWQRECDTVRAELDRTKADLEKVNLEYVNLHQAYSHLLEISAEHEQLKVTHLELSQHYEQLYNQANDIVSGNQLLNEQNQNNQVYISELEQQLNEAQMKCEHLSACNSELNTQRCEMEMRCMEMSERCEQMERELGDMESLREAKIELETCKERLSKVESELEEQRDLVDQLNQAKEFLAENNSKLLTNIIKIQLFVESMGLDQTEIESVPKVKAYEEAIERLKSSEAELQELRNELNIKSQKPLKHDKQTQFDSLLDELEDCKAEHEANLDRLRREKESLADELTKVREKSSNDEVYLSLKDECEKLKDKLSAVEKLNAKLKVKLKQLLKENKSTAAAEDESTAGDNSNSSNPESSELESIKRQLDESTVLNNRLESLYETIRGEKEQLEREVRELREKSVSSSAPVNQEEVKSFEMNLANVESEREELLREVNSIRGELEHTMKQYSRLEELYKAESGKFEESESKLAASEKMVAKLKAKLKQILKEKEQNKPADNSESVQETSTDVDLDALKSTIEEKSAEIESLKTKLDEISLLNHKLESSYESARDEKEALTRELFDIQEKWRLEKFEQNLDVDRRLEEMSSKLAASESLVIKLKQMLKSNDEERSGGDLSPSRNIELQRLVEFGAKLAASRLENDLIVECEQLVDDFSRFRLARQLSFDRVKSELAQKEREIERLREATQSDHQHGEIDSIREDLERSKALLYEKEQRVSELETQLEETTAKLATNEKTSLKLKAKLKQLMQKEKSAAAAAETEASGDQSGGLLIAAKDLSPTAASPSQLESSSTSSLHLHEPDVDVDAFKTEIESLKAEIDSLKHKLDESLSLNNKLEGLYESIREEKAQIEKELVESKEKSTTAQTANVEELKSFELNFANLQTENESLSEELTRLRSDLESKNEENSKLEQLYKSETAKIEEIETKLATSEKMVAKLKIKLKQVLKEKEHQAIEVNTSENLLVSAKDISPVSQNVEAAEKSFEIDTLKNTIVEKSNEVESLRQQLDESTALVNRLESLYESVRGEKEQIERDLAELKEKSTTAQNTNVEELKSFELNFANLQTENESLSEELTRLRSDLESKNEENSKLEQLYKSETAKIEEIETKLATSEKMVAKLKIKLKQVLKEKEHSEVVHNEAESVESTDKLVVSQLKAEKESLEALIDEKNKGLETLNAQIAQIGNEMSQLKWSYEEKLSEAERELSASKESLSSLEAQNAELLNELSQLKWSHEETVGQSSILKAENEKLVTECENLTAKVDNLEKTSLKLKAKLKQMLKEQQQQKVENIGGVENSSLLTVASSQQQQHQQQPVEIQEISPVSMTLLQSSSSPHPSASHEELDRLRTEITSQKDELAQQESVVDELRRSNESLRRSNEELGLYRDELKANVDHLLGELGRVEAEKQALIEQLNELRRANEAVEAKLAEKSGEIEQIKVEINHKESDLQRILDEKCRENENLIEQLNKLQETVNSKWEDNESIEQIKAEMSHRLSDLQRILDEKCQENENLIEKLNKFQETVNSKSDDNESIEEIRTKLEHSQQQNLKLKAKLKQLMASTTKATTAEAESQTEVAELTIQTQSTESNHHDEEVASIQMTASPMAHRFDDEMSTMSTAATSRASPLNLEAQLKYCHEECEKVVLKLRQLKRHNESLNNKIKSIKSSMVVT